MNIRGALFIIIGILIVGLFLSGIEIISGHAVFIKNNNLFQENKITQIEVFPKIVKMERIGDSLVKDTIGIRLLPGSNGAYKKVEFLRKDSSQVLEEFNLDCTGFKCTEETIGYQTIDIKWKTGDYIARVKDGSQDYIKAEFYVKNVI